jgi:hypothetical protein
VLGTHAERAERQDRSGVDMPAGQTTCPMISSWPPIATSDSAGSQEPQARS